MRLMRRSASALSVTLVATLALSACGSSDNSSAEVVEGPWEDVVAAATDEGRVNLYSVAPPFHNDRVIEAFNKEHPEIEVVVTRGAGELVGRVEQEISSGTEGADVLIYTDPALFSKLSDDLLDLDGPASEDWSDEFWVEEGKAIVPNKYPWTLFIWNTDIFPDGFKTWDDLLAPEVKGKLATRSDMTTSMAATFQFMEEELGEDYLKKQGQQNPKFYNSAVPMAQAVASGEAGVAYLSTPAIVMDLQLTGAPVDSAVPDPVFSISWGAGALENSRRPNAARVFTDFLMSPAGQEAINGDGLGAAGIEGVPGALDPTGWAEFDSASITPEVISDMEQRFSRWFKQ